MAIDSLGRNYKSSNFGSIWTEPEIGLLKSLCEKGARPRIAVAYNQEAVRLGLPIRSRASIVGKLQRHYPQTKQRYCWSAEEDNQVSELLQDYPFGIALAKYQQWARAEGYPVRDGRALYCRASKLRISTIDPVAIAGISTISRSLGISTHTATKYIRQSRIKTQLVGQRVTCDVDRFYRWFVSSKSWIKCLHGCVQTGRGNIDLDNWSLLLDIPLKDLKAEYKRAQENVMKVRSPLGFDALRINEFAKQNHISANAIWAAIRKGRSEVAGIKFEVCATK
jgi:hypothetical protein